MMRRLFPKKLARRPRGLMLWILATIFVSCAVYAEEVCRSASFVGMESRTEAIHNSLGENTSDVRKIRIFVSSEEGTPYIQSNFISPDLDNPGTFSSFPTKLRTGKVRDLRDALRNILFYYGSEHPEGWRPEFPENAESMIDEALASMDILVDVNSLDRDGRPPIDLSGARSLKIGTDHSSIASGEIELLNTKRPPPLLIERLFDCCFNGRPPGKGVEIKQRLEQQSIRPEDTVLLKLVLDSTTDLNIADTTHVKAAQERAGIVDKDDWPTRISKAMGAAKGRTLVVLGHISGADLVVEGRDSEAIHSVSLWQLKEDARKNGVHLVVLGCDTAKFIAEESMGMGVSGSYNTADAVARLEAGLAEPKNAAEFLRGLASPTLKIVVDPSATVGKPMWVSGLAKVRGQPFYVRVFRMLFLGNQSDG